VNSEPLIVTLSPAGRITRRGTDRRDDRTAQGR
jgi:hypothetical protein